MEFIVRVGPELQRKINQKRNELIYPPEQLERAIETKLHEEYEQVRAINNSLTSFLISAAEVSQNQSRYLEDMGLSDEALGEVINQTDAAVSALLKGAEETEERIATTEEYLRKLEAIQGEF